MTPFDPVALLAMLRAFYPVAGAEVLLFARIERPDYFAGGTLVGSHGDKLLLPDGRVFDLIFGAGDPDPSVWRWQVIDVTSGGGGENPFPLAPGPFTPIDARAWPEPNPQPVFVPLVAAAYYELGDPDALLGQASSEIVAHASPAALLAVFSDTIDAADAAVDSSRRQLDLADPSDVIVAAGGVVPTFDSHEDEFSEPEPDDLGTPTPPIDLPTNPRNQEPL